MSTSESEVEGLRDENDWYRDELDLLRAKVKRLRALLVERVNATSDHVDCDCWECRVRAALGGE